jgi:hypothetical protein
MGAVARITRRQWRPSIDREHRGRWVGRGISRARFPRVGGEVGVVDVAGVGAAAEIAGEAGSGKSDAEAEHGALWTPTLQSYRVVPI